MTTTNTLYGNYVFTGSVTATSFAIGSDVISSFTNLAAISLLDYEDFVSTNGAFVVMTGAGTFGLDETTYQPYDDGLSGLAAMATTVGLVKQTSANTFGIDTNTYLTTGDAGTTYVPYSGATGTVNLGSQVLTTTGNISGAIGTFTDVYGTNQKIRLSPSSYIQFYPNRALTDRLSLLSANVFGTNDLFIQFQPQAAGANAVFESYNRNFYISAGSNSLAFAINLCTQRIVRWTVQSTGDLVAAGAYDITTTGKVTAKLVAETAASDPQDATPANRPAGVVGQICYYSGKLYFCTNAATPTWELITSA